MFSATSIATLRFFRHPSFALAFALVTSLVWAICAPAVNASGSGNDNECTPSSNVTQLSTETASAGVIANMTNRSNSIRAISHRMLTSAIDTAKSKEPRQQVIFTSMPELSKKTTSDDQMCARHEQATKKHAIEFNDKRFGSADELTDWIMDFTQGKGADGKSLYEQCPGKCSPQYTWRIEPEESSKLKVQARVVCGIPRDRDGDLYHLTTALAVVCGN